MKNINNACELKNNAKLLTTLLEVSNLVSSTMDLKPLLEAILDKLKSIIEYNNAKIFAVSEGQIKVIAHRSELSPQQEDSYPLPMARLLVAEKEPVVIDDLHSDNEIAVSFRNNMSRYMETLFKDVHCWMSLPMVSKDKVIGVLTLDHKVPGFYKAHHVELGTAFANQAAIEFENAKLYNETVKRADEIKTMFNIQQAITSRLELDSVLRLIAGEARRLTNSHITAVFLIDKEELVLKVLSGSSNGNYTGLRLPLCETKIADCLKLHESVILSREQLMHGSERSLVEETGMLTCLCVPLMAGTKAVGIIATFSRNVREFNSEDERIFNMFAPTAVIGIENARLYQEEKRQHQENEQRRHVAEGLRDVLNALNSSRPLDEILNFILKEATRIFHTDSASLFKLNSGKNELVLEAKCGLPYLTPHITTISIDAGIEGKAFVDRRPIVISNLSEIDRINKMAGYPDEHTKWLMENYMSAIAVPLICKEEIYGGLTIYLKKDENKAEQSVLKEDISLAITFADQAALAIDNTHLKKQAEEIAVAAERNRLARDLHDAVTQTLFSASLIAEVLPRIWERSPEDGANRLGELRQLTRGALAEMRTLLFELRPATLVEAPLEELLRQLSEATTGRARIPVALDINIKTKPPTEVKIAFYRIAQEALNNIAKHSGAKNASVKLNINAAEQSGSIVAELEIIDDGHGFEPRKVTSEHFGLGIMRERAEAIGSKLNIESQASKGTRITLEWVGSINP